MSIEYINKTGSKKNTQHHDGQYRCTSCKYNKSFLTIPSLKTVKRCSKTGVKTKNLQFRTCKFYKNKKFPTTIIIGV